MLIFYIHTINTLYAVAGLLTLLATFGLIYDLVWNEQKIYKRYLAPYIWWLIILTTWGGLATTLLYSEYFGFIPCSLCWLQRVALYPQAFLSIAAFRTKDVVNFQLYGIILSIFGLVVAIYQYIYQALPTELLTSGVVPCLADGSADCGKKVMEVFGFVTFPFLSAVLFVFLTTLYLHQRKASRGN